MTLESGDIPLSASLNIPEGPREPPPPPEFKLIKPPLLLEITDRLIKEKPSEDEWEQLAKKFINEGIKPPENKINSQFSEFAVGQQLRKISASYPGQVVFDPIPLGAIVGEDQFKQYQFVKHRGQLYVIRYDGNNPNELNQQIIKERGQTEYDLLFEVNGIPVVGEIKLEKLGKYGISKRSLREMDMDRISNKTGPVRKYFSTVHNQKNCAFVYMIPPEAIDPNSPVQQEFEKNGGILLPFYMNLEEYLKLMGRLRNRFEF